MNGQYLWSGSADHQIKIWDIHSGHCLQTLGGGTAEISCILLLETFTIGGSANGSILAWSSHTCSENSDLVLVKAPGAHRTGAVMVDCALECNSFFFLHADRILALFALGDCKQFASLSVSGELCIWRTDTWECQQTISLHQSSSDISCAELYGNVLITGGEDSTVKLWNILTGDNIVVLNQDSPVCCLLPIRDTLCVGLQKCGITNIWQLTFK